jgi:hypothetical protein
VVSSDCAKDQPIITTIAQQISIKLLHQFKLIKKCSDANNTLLLSNLKTTVMTIIQIVVKYFIILIMETIFAVAKVVGAAISC